MTRQSTSTSVKMPLSFHGGIRSKKIPGWILRLRSDVSGLSGLKNFLLSLGLLSLGAVCRRIR